MTLPLPPLADLHEVKPARYWTDFALSAALGWAAFALAAVRPLGSPLGALATLVAVFALYRALAFTHELSHQRHRLPGFEAAWNLGIGFPLLLPSFTYAQVHLDHHRVSTYGTSADPEYLPFARSALTTAVYALHTLAVPAILVVRYLLLAPLGFLVPRLETALIARASAITINHAYVREVTPALRAVVRRDTLKLLALWAVLVALAVAGDIPPQAAVLWYAVFASIGLIDALRTLAAHAYESAGAPIDKAAQTADSHDIPGRVWTELWAPVGLRYHATHHAFPGIPYHALPAAYRRLTAAMPEGYGAMTRSGLARTLLDLVRKGMRAR